MASGLPSPWGQAAGRPVIVGHRAGGNEAPENTLAALRSAEAAGATVMQMDILPTAEGVPVIFHDTNMRRATGVDVDIRQVKLDNLPPYKEVLDPLIPTPNARPVRTGDFKDGSCIPTLKQLLHEAATTTYLQLEIWDENKALVDRVAEEIRSAGMTKRVILGSPGNARIWQMCRDSLPEAQTILPMSEIYRVYLYYFLGALNLWQHPSNVVFNVALFTGWEKYFLPAIPVKGWQRVILTASIYFMKWLVPRPKLFKWLQDHDIPVVVFILNRPEDWDAALKLDSVNAIMTDSPQALAQYLKRVVSSVHDK